MNKEQDIKFVLETKNKLNKTEWNFERKDILEKSVEHFREKEYSDQKIKELFKDVILKEQDNSQMVSNNNRYLDLLNEILNS